MSPRSSFHYSVDHRRLPSFPTRRSSDLPAGSAVSSPPSVIVHDGSGNPVQGVTVTFAAAAGSGSEGHRHALHRIAAARSEEHTSELQSLTNLVCRLLLEKKKKIPEEVIR